MGIDITVRLNIVRDSHNSYPGVVQIERADDCIVLTLDNGDRVIKVDARGFRSAADILCGEEAS